MTRARGNPPAIQTCTKTDHPAQRHGHYGSGPFWCTDFRSQLLTADNGGVIERGWIVIYEKETGDDH